MYRENLVLHQNAAEYDAASAGGGGGDGGGGGAARLDRADSVHGGSAFLKVMQEALEKTVTDENIAAGQTPAEAAAAKRDSLSSVGSNANSAKVGKCRLTLSNPP